jgi:hypothetical protein
MTTGMPQKSGYNTCTTIPLRCVGPVGKHPENMTAVSRTIDVIIRENPKCYISARKKRHMDGLDHG